MLMVHWILFILSFMLVGTSPNSDSFQANFGICLFMYSIGMVIYLLIKKPKPKPKQQVIIQQVGDDEMKVQNINVEQSQAVGKLEVKRGMKKDSQVFKLIKLGMILGAFIGVAIMGIETIKALALVIAIVLGCIIVLFLFIVLPLLIVFKDTVKLFITKKKED
jgi:hypothetical protein